MTLPQAASQPSPPASVIAGGSGSVIPSYGSRPSPSATVGGRFAELFARAAGRTHADGDSVSVEQPGSAAKQTPALGLQNAAEPAVNRSATPNSANALAQFLAAQSNTSLISTRALGPARQYTNEMAENAADSAGTSLKAATASIGGQSSGNASSASAKQPNRTPAFSATRSGYSAQARRLSASEPEHTTTVGSTLEQEQGSGAAPQARVGAGSTAGGSSAKPVPAETADQAAAQASLSQPSEASANLSAVPASVGAGQNAPDMKATADGKSSGDGSSPARDPARLGGASSATPDARTSRKSMPVSAAAAPGTNATLPNFMQFLELPVPTDFPAPPNIAAKVDSGNDRSGAVIGSMPPAGSTAATTPSASLVADLSSSTSSAPDTAPQPDQLAFALAASSAAQAPDRTTAGVEAPGTGSVKASDHAPVAIAAVAGAVGGQGALIGTGAWHQPTTAVMSGPRDPGNSATTPPETPGTADVHAESKLPGQDGVRVLRVQLMGDNNQRVDVRMGEAGGELRVSVRSTDPTLTQTLQEQMPDLTSRLSDQRLHTEVWMPRETTATGGSGARSGESSFSGGNPNGQSQQERRQNGQNSYQPEWIDELEANPRRIQTARRS